MSDVLGEAEALAIAYAPAPLRPRYRILFEFDAELARIALAAREPLPAQLRLAWWRDACSRFPAGMPTPPLLASLARHLGGHGAALVALVDAWEEVAVAAPDDYARAVDAVARQRSEVLALAAGEPAAPLKDAVWRWTLTTLAEHAPDTATRLSLRAAARASPTGPLPRSLRPLAVLAGLAERALTADRARLLGDRLSPLAAMRLGIFGR